MRGVAIAAGVAAAAAQQLTGLCTLDVPSLGVTYDLSNLVGTTNNVQDNRNDTDLVSFDTWFGVCQDIVPRADFLPSCMQTQGDNNAVTYGPGGIFQVDSRNGICHRLGGNASAGVMSVAMSGDSVRGMKDRIYAHGVMLNYTGGDVCTDWVTGVEYPRSTTLFYECYDNPVNPQAAVIIEETTCQYFIIIRSRHGCPTQCRKDGAGRVCSGHGVCGYDATNSKAKCYCNSGWESPDGFCSAFNGVDAVKPQPSYGGNIAGAFFGGLFGGVILVLAYVAVKVKMAGGEFKEILNVGAIFGGFAGGAGGSAGGAIGSAYAYAKAPEAPAFAGTAGAAADYAPPAVDAPAYAPPADGPLLA